MLIPQKTHYYISQIVNVHLNIRRNLRDFEDRGWITSIEKKKG